MVSTAFRPSVAGRSSSPPKATSGRSRRREATAVRLTAHEGDEKFPRISPDGKLVAFTAQYEGNDDVYVMSADGGEPVRLTWHPMPDQALGWTADGKVLFRSRRDHPHGDFRVYTVEPTGGIPQMIPLEPAAWISFEPGGTRRGGPEDGPRVPQLEALQGRRGREDLRRHARSPRLRRGHEVRREERLPDVGAPTAASTSSPTAGAARTSPR